MSFDVIFVGGPHDLEKVKMSKLPPRWYFFVPPPMESFYSRLTDYADLPVLKLSKTDEYERVYQRRDHQNGEPVMYKYVGRS